jgi:hypothetical protein
MYVFSLKFSTLNSICRIKNKCTPLRDILYTRFLMCIFQSETLRCYFKCLWIIGKGTCKNIMKSLVRIHFMIDYDNFEWSAISYWQLFNMYQCINTPRSFILPGWIKSHKKRNDIIIEWWKFDNPLFNSSCFSITHAYQFRYYQYKY